MVRTALIVLEILSGVCALGSAGSALARSKGVARERSHSAPFKTFFVPGLVLLVLIGGSMLAAAGLLLAGGSAARLVSLEAGIVLLGWVGAQLATIGFRHWWQPFLLALGLAVVVLSFLLRSPG